VPLERVCRQRSLEAAAEGNNRRQIFLNLSPAAASDPEFLGPLFRDQVMALGLEPDRIVLEITERTYAVYEGLFREVCRSSARRISASRSMTSAPATRTCPRSRTSSPTT
jgi:EAL domain-containing protein (putative c-di-GMP-specific phosphodiesterase class I)